MGLCEEHPVEGVGVMRGEVGRGHRVVRSDGKLGEYNRGGEARKRDLLRAENAL